MRGPIHGSMQARQAGFTLLEILIAMVLLSLVLAVGAGALRQLGTGFDRGTRQADLSRDLALARDVLRRQAVRALPLREGGPTGGGYVFRGTAVDLAFPIMEPPAPGRGGGALVHFIVEETETGRRLVHVQRPFPDGPEHRSVLADGPFVFRFAYLDAGGRTVPEWRPAWTGRPGFPAQVRLDVMVDGVQQPPTVVPFRVDADPGCVPMAVGDGFCRDTAGSAP